jgi:plastocyanin
MRSPIFLAATGLSLVLAGCVGDISGTGDDTSGNTGNDNQGTDPTNNNGNNGNNGSNGNTNNPPASTPSLTGAVDKTTLSTELFTSNMVTVTLTGAGGFSGSVALVASAVDDAGAAITGWTVSLDKSSVDVAANGTATAVATVKIPSDSKVMAGKVKVDATSSLGTTSLTSAVTVAPTLTVNVVRNGQACTYPTDMVGTVSVPSGTTIRWVNDATSTGNITVHITENKIGGLAHEQGATAPGGVYMQTVTGATGTTDWYCHNLNDPKNMNLTVAK